MQPSRSSQSIFGSFLAVLAIAFTASTLTGCVPLAFAPLAVVGVQHLPGDVKLEVAEPGKGALGPLGNVRTVVTNNEFAHKYLHDRQGLFSKVTLTKSEPATLPGAAKAASSSGHDAFVLVEPQGATKAGNMLIPKVSYGGVKVTIVYKDSTVLYRQTAQIVAKPMTEFKMTDREIAEALANAIVDDIQASKGQPVQTTTLTEPKETGGVSGAWNKFKGLFD